MLICDAGGAGEPPLKGDAWTFRARRHGDRRSRLLLFSRPRADGWVLRVKVSGSHGSVLVYGVFLRRFLLCGDVMGEEIFLR